MSKKIAFVALVMMMFNLSSRVLGFVRESIIANYFGANFYIDAYFIALTLTASIFTAIGTALGTSVTPLLTRLYSQDKEYAGTYANNLITMYSLFSIIVVVLGCIFASPLIKMIATGYDGQEIVYAAGIARIMFPLVIFAGLASIATAVLNANYEFVVPSFITVPYNLVIIVIVVVCSKYYGVYALAVSTVIGFIAQFAAQYPKMRKIGWKYRFVLNLKDENIRNSIKMFMPVFISTAVTTINLVVDRALASSLEDGSVSALNYANRVTLLANISIIITGSLVFPRFAKLSGDKEGLGKLYSYSNKLIIYVTVPITIYTVFMNLEMVRFLFQRGEFTDHSSTLTSYALLYYMLGIVPIGIREITNRAYFSLHNSKIPMYFGFAAVFLNVVLSFILSKIMQVGGIALASSLSTLLTMPWFMHRFVRTIGYREKKWGWPLALLLVSAGMMAGSLYAFREWMMPHMKSMVLIIGVSMILSCACYLLPAAVIYRQRLKHQYFQLLSGFRSHYFKERSNMPG